MGTRHVETGWSSKYLSGFGRPLFLKIARLDPRWTIAAILLSYNFLGFTVLGFNRSPIQMIITTLLASVFELGLCYFVHRKLFFPISAIITSFSLTLLLNYSHSYLLLCVPVFFAIGSKYLFTINGKHFFNPALMGVTLSLIFMGDLITAAPAYQWNGIENLYIFMILLAALFLLPQINRHWLVLSFLITFTLQTALRALIMRHHLPFETLFFGTLSSPSFILFTFFMITDPATSPPDKKTQIFIGMAIALVDLSFHLFQSYFTFFYAGVCVAGSRFFYLHLKNFSKRQVFSSAYFRKLLATGVLGTFLFSGVAFSKYNQGIFREINWKFIKIDNSHSNLNFSFGNIFERVDKRVQHIIKWLFGVGDSVAISDFNNDGLSDLFLTNMLKEDSARAALFINKGNFQFERFSEESLTRLFSEPEINGLPTNGLFVDYDNDGDQDLFVTVAFGSSRLFQNQLSDKGIVSFLDVTEKVGLLSYSNSITADFFDVNNDGLLDLIIGNVWPDFLPNYESPKYLNLFNLPKIEFEGDDRPFDFMHASWHQANNGGRNEIYLQDENGSFNLDASLNKYLPESRWSLAIGTTDLDKDGWTDIYIANDFGADDLYFNKNGKSLENHKGQMFGTIGKDTYKGMNVSFGDFDKNGFFDVYVSNVHHALQAEGSLLWSFSKSVNGILEIVDQATRWGALNENRFGWGASVEDFNNDGWQDIIQANGMVDDSIDKISEDCPDYWYINEKIARSPPSYHRYANKWGDIRGMCIYGKEKNRVYINRGFEGKNGFIDVADRVGINDLTNSRGVAASDFNNDGKLDVIVTHMFKSPSLYESSGLADSNWVKIKLVGDGKSCNKNAVGSRVKLYSRINPQIKEVTVASGFSAQSDMILHFGLGDSRSPLKVEINWCGKLLSEEVIEPNRLHTIFMKGHP